MGQNKVIRKVEKLLDQRAHCLDVEPEHPIQEMS